MRTYLHFGRASSSVSKTPFFYKKGGFLRLRCGGGPYRVDGALTLIPTGATIGT